MRASLATARNADKRTGAVAFACVVCAALVATYAFGTVPHDHPPFERWDLASYRAMAEAAPALAQDVSRHFAYRIAGPWLAGVLPLAEAAAFRLVTTVALLFTAVALLGFLERRGVGRGAAVVATLAFVFNKHMFGYPAWNPFHAGDALAMLALVLGYDAMITRRLGRLSLIFLAGLLARESVLLLVPTAFVHAATSRPRGHALGPDDRRGGPTNRVARDAPRLGAAFAPGLCAYVTLRLLLPSSGETTFLDAFVHHAPKLASLETWLRLLVHAPGPLALVPLVFAGSTGRFFRAHPEAGAYLLFVFASTLLGSNNERLMGPAFVVFYWLVASLLATATAGHPVYLWALVPIAVAGAAHHLYARWPLPSDTHTAWITALALAAATAVVLHAVYRRRAVASAAQRAERSGPIGSR